MVKNILIGISFALSAGLQPGPLQAFFLAKASQNGWRKTLPGAFAPLISDGPIALVSILLINFLPHSFRNWLQLAGGIILLYFAWSAYKNRRQEEDQGTRTGGSAPKTLFQAALVNLLNPAPYLGWSLVMGPAVLAAWVERPGLAVALLISFYFTLIGTSMLLIYLIGRTVSLGSGIRRSFTLVSAFLLAGLGLYFLVQAGIQLAAWQASATAIVIAVQVFWGV